MFKTFELEFTCPKCNKNFSIRGYWRWILKAPFHYFEKRKTKCPHCDKKSYVGWNKITKI